MRAIATTAIVVAALSLAACKHKVPSGPREYAYPPWGFEAAFPAQPKETDTPPDGVNPHTFTSEYQDATHDFAVLASDLSGRTVDLDAMADGAAGFLAQSSGALPGTKTYAATSDGVDGREYRLTKGGKAIGAMQFFIASGHFYQLSARSTLGPDDPAVKAFLASFHTLAAAPADANSTLGDINTAPPPTNGAPSP